MTEVKVICAGTKPNSWECRACCHAKPHFKLKDCNTHCYQDEKFTCKEDIKGLRKDKLLKILEMSQVRVQCTGAHIPNIGCDLCHHFKPHIKKHDCDKSCWRIGGYHCIENLNELRKAKLLKINNI